MIKRKLFVAGMTAFAITTATGIAALASQDGAYKNAFGRGAQNEYIAGQNFSDRTSSDTDFMQNEKGMNNFDNFKGNFDFDNNQSEDKPEIGATDNNFGGQKFGEAVNNSDEKPVLGRKSDEEAMQEGNPTPELPEGVSVESQTSQTDTNQNSERPVLGRKSDEEAMKEGNPKPALPVGVTVDDTNVQ